VRAWYDKNTNLIVGAFTMDEQMFRKVLSEMLNPIKDWLEALEVRFDSVDERLNNIQTKLNTIENRVVDLNESIRLAVRQNSAEMGDCVMK
jgi:septation ring formation regulator EzrA